MIQNPKNLNAYDLFVERHKKYKEFIHYDNNINYCLIKSFSYLKFLPTLKELNDFETFKRAIKVIHEDAEDQSEIFWIISNSEDDRFVKYYIDYLDKIDGYVPNIFVSNSRPDLLNIVMNSGKIENVKWDIAHSINFLLDSIMDKEKDVSVLGDIITLMKDQKDDLEYEIRSYLNRYSWIREHNMDFVKKIEEMCLSKGFEVRDPYRDSS